MASGTIVEWHVKEGDPVHRGDILVSVEADKGTIDVESHLDGVVESLEVPVGRKVPVGTVLATVGTGTDRPRRVLATPLARRMAAMEALDLEGITGTGPRGSIHRRDVEKALAGRQSRGAPPAAVEPAAARPAGEEVPASTTVVAPDPHPTKPRTAASGMRQAIARAMSRSNSDIPHYYLQTRIDMSRALARLELENQARPMKDRILPVVLLLEAVAKGLQEVPDLNGFWQEDGARPQEEINIGFAISLRQGGLVTPALLAVDSKTPEQLMAELNDMILRARAGRLRSGEATGGTITVTSLGDLGVETVFGVIFPPQLALVGFGKITEQPWAENGMIGARRVVVASLAADHRATDGHRGARFLDCVKRWLEEGRT